jgi:hypothetical protein
MTTTRKNLTTQTDDSTSIPDHGFGVERAALANQIGGAPMTVPKRMLSVGEFCYLYGIGKTTAYGEMAAKRLPYRMCGRRRLIPVDGAETWAAPTQQPSPSSNPPTAGVE